jgi:ATP-dependent Clp protease ATP-binding subunit ClpA
MPNKSKLGPAVEAKLKRLHLRLDMADPDTLVLKNVPANHHCFSKARTNLLIKRFNESMPWVVCVDENLNYRGGDAALTHTFGAAILQNGWRVLTFGGSLHGDLTTTLELALDMLGADQEPAAAPPPRAKGLLAAWEENLTDAILSGRAAATLFRDEAVEQVAACILRWQGRLPLILGRPGTGKTNLLYGVAARLVGRNQKVLAVNAGALMAGALFESEREALWMSLLREAEDSGVVLALEQAEWAVVGVPRGPVLLRHALDRGVRLMATSSPEQAGRFSVHPLASRLEIVHLNELCASDTRSVLEALRPSLAAHHDVRIDAEVEHAAVERAISMTGLLPGKAVGLLDAAAAHASLDGNAAVTLMDVYLAASRLQGDGD